jgi:hypothetical protein
MKVELKKKIVLNLSKTNTNSDSRIYPTQVGSCGDFTCHCSVGGALSNDANIKQNNDNNCLDTGKAR